MEQPITKPPVQPVNLPAAPQMPSVAPVSPKKKSKWWIWACCGVALIVGLIVAGLAVAGFVFYKNVGNEINNAGNANLDLEENVNAVVSNVNQNKNTNQASTTAKRETLDTKKYNVEETVTLKNEGPATVSKMSIKLAMIKNHELYQKVLSKTLNPSKYEVITDKYQNEYAKIDLGGLAPKGKKEIKANYQVEVNAVKDSLGTCTGKDITTDKTAETFIDSDDPAMKAVADKLVEGKKNNCEKARAAYDYVGDNMTYSGYVAEDNGSLMALDSKKGDCTDFADLFLGLSRASGVSARFVEGVVYSPGETDVTQMKHDWTEAYFPGTGWAMVDPTFGRAKSDRNNYFAQSDGTRIVVTTGRNLDTLESTHYFYYTYNWDNANETTTVNYDEGWKITPVN